MLLKCFCVTVVTLIPGWNKKKIPRCPTYWNKFSIILIVSQLKIKRDFFLTVVTVFAILPAELNKCQIPFISFFVKLTACISTNNIYSTDSFKNNLPFHGKTAQVKKKLKIFKKYLRSPFQPSPCRFAFYISTLRWAKGFSKIFFNKIIKYKIHLEKK